MKKSIKEQSQKITFKVGVDMAGQPIFHVIILQELK